jgi:chromosome segregation ATPase
VTVFSIFKFTVLLKEKYRLTSALNQLEQQLTAMVEEGHKLAQKIEEDKQIQDRLNQEVTSLKGYLRASAKRLVKLFKDFSEEKEAIEKLGEKFSLLKAENKALIRQRQRFAQENQALMLKMSSIDELQNLIRDLKRKKITPLSPSEGNRGYLIKDGKIIVPSSVKIEVVPTEENPEAQDSALKNSDLYELIPAPKRE